jgi:hypothetical protein
MSVPRITTLLFSILEILTRNILTKMSLNENLSKILDVEPLPQKENKQEIMVVEKTDMTEVENDYQLARNTLRDMIKKGNGALDHLIDISRETEHPRSYEVTSTLIKTISDSATALMELQKKNKDIRNINQESNVNPNNINVEKAVFVGTPADLLKKIKSHE